MKTSPQRASHLIAVIALGITITIIITIRQRQQDTQPFSQQIITTKASFLGSMNKSNVSTTFLCIFLIPVMKNGYNVYGSSSTPNDPHIETYSFS
jgi:hypothetical protein